MRDGPSSTAITARQRAYSIAARRVRISGAKTMPPAFSIASDCGTGGVSTTAPAVKVRPVVVFARQQSSARRSAATGISK